MNNGDMPAAPLTGDVQIDRDGLEAVGLSKRESVAKGVYAGLIASGRATTLSAKGLAQLAVEYTDALLTELDK